MEGVREGKRKERGMVSEEGKEREYAKSDGNSSNPTLLAFRSQLYTCFTKNNSRCPPPATYFLGDLTTLAHIPYHYRSLREDVLAKALKLKDPHSCFCRDTCSMHVDNGHEMMLRSVKRYSVHNTCILH